MRKQTELPLTIDPFRAAGRAQQLAGRIAIADMARLAESLAASTGSAVVRLAFDTDEAKVPHVNGELVADLQLECQRCLQSFTHQIVSQFRLGLLHSEADAANLSPSYEPWVVTAGELILRDMIEEELLISLPIVPMHDAASCPVGAAQLDSSDPLSDESQAHNPFSVIEKLCGKETV